MSVDSEILINNYGVTAEFADQILEFTNGDLEGCIQILENAEKDIVVLKAKFISSKRLLYGAMVIFYNYQNMLPQYVLCALSTNMDLSRIKMDLEWQNYVQEIMMFTEARESNNALAAEVESEILTPANIEYLNAMFAVRDNIDELNIKRLLLNVIGKVLMDNKVILKMVLEKADVFKFQTLLPKLKKGRRLDSQTGVKEVMLINLAIEPVLAPLGGIDIEKIVPDDEIMVKIIDEREISLYIQKLLGSIDDLGVPRGIFGKVVNNSYSPDSGNRIVNLMFGPGIYGSFIIGSKVRVQLKESAKEKAPVDTEDKVTKAPAYLNEHIQEFREAGDIGDLKPLKSGAPPLMYDKEVKSKAQSKKSGKFYKILSLIIGGIIVLIILMLLIFGVG